MDPLLSLASAHAQRYLANIRERHVGATTDGAALRALLGGPLADGGEDAQSVIDALGQAGADGTVATRGPRYFGFVVGGSFQAATAADWLVSTWDQNTGIYALSPITSVVEEIAAGWTTDLLGLEGGWSAGFVTGGQMANFTCLLAARHHVLEKAGWDVESQGLAGAPPIDVIVSEEAHYSIGTSLRMMGLGAERALRVPADDQGRMQLDAVEAALARNDGGPCIVCTQAGNVNTGAFDPIAPIITAARRRDAWVHVDGAFGAWAAVSPSRKHLVDGMAQADSIATDAHKWLNVPYDCGIALTAHPDTHRRALTLPAHYIQETKDARDPHEFTPEESRRARAIPLYAVLRVLGRTGLADLVDRCCALAQRMAARLSTHTSLKVLNDVVLNQVLVGCTPASPGDADAFTDAVIDEVQRDGTCWLGGTRWKGARAIRISVSNWSTTEADIDRSADAILRAIDRAQR